MTATIQQPLPITPGAMLDVYWDWSAWLGTDTIASFTVTATNGLSLSSVAQNAGKVVAWVSPAASVPDGTTYTAVCGIVTNSTPARVDSRVIKFVVQANR